MHYVWKATRDKIYFYLEFFCFDHMKTTLSQSHISSDEEKTQHKVYL